MVTCHGTSIVIFLLTVIATGKATKEMEEFHSCCENQEVLEGSNVSLTFYTDFDFKLKYNKLLEVKNNKDIVLQWTLRDASDPIVRNGYLYDITHNRTLTLLIPIVTSSHAGEYVMTHTLVRHPQKCRLQVRQHVESNKILSQNCRTPGTVTLIIPTADSFVVREDKLPLFIVPLVTLGVFCVIAAVLCIAKKHRYICFKERQEENTCHGHGLNSTLSGKGDVIEQPMENN